MDFLEYKKLINQGLDSVDPNKYGEASSQLDLCMFYNNTICIFGNGGSAAIADHFVTDFVKGVRHDTKKLTSAISLSSNASLLTAIANDYGYDEIFSKQIEYENTDLLAIAVSSSGNSPNILKALETTIKLGIPSIALVGFDGGKVLRNNMAETIIHVAVDNYGVVEDCHMMILHSLVQNIRTGYAKDPSAIRI